MATLTKSGGSKSILTITSKLIKVIPINITEIQKKNWMKDNASNNNNNGQIELCFLV